MLVEEQVLLESIAQRVKAIRLDYNWTQAEVSKRSGVTLGSIRRFEQTGEISLASLYKISEALLRINDWNQLFLPKPVMSIKEIERLNKEKPRKRARSKGIKHARIN